MLSIETDVLIAYGASIQKVEKNAFIFTEGNEPHFFYQLLKGQIKMISLSADGKELLQGFGKEGECFGEAPLFIEKPYPSTAIALKDSVILKLSREKMMVLMEDRPSITIGILQNLAERVYKKAVTAKILSISNPEEKILTFFDHYKKENELCEESMIPYTRQQIADSTGLCVETVIRTVIKLCKDKKVAIQNHKVYY